MVDSNGDLAAGSVVAGTEHAVWVTRDDGVVVSCFYKGVEGVSCGYIFFEPSLAEDEPYHIYQKARL